MKIYSHLVAVLLAGTVLSLSTATVATADTATELTLPVPATEMTDAQWHAFSVTLQKALASGHNGLQIAAMRLAIQYADNVDIRSSVIDLMRIYRNHSDQNVRRLAVVALGSLHSGMVINYLRLNEPFEETPCVKRTIHAVVSSA